MAEQETEKASILERVAQNSFRISFPSYELIAEASLSILKHEMAEMAAVGTQARERDA